MNDHFFSLQPFPSTTVSDAELDLEIIGTIARQQQQLIIRYSVLGDLSAVAIETATTKPTRQDNLWEATCFEFFLGIPRAKNYWEFNLSPSGNWNVYRFKSYREARCEETAIRALPFRIQTEPDALSIAVDFDLSILGTSIPAHSPLEVGITTVIQQTNRKITYWALTHPSKEADFHQRESFVIKL